MYESLVQKRWACESVHASDEAMQWERWRVVTFWGMAFQGDQGINMAIVGNWLLSLDIESLIL